MSSFAWKTRANAHEFLQQQEDNCSCNNSRISKVLHAAVMAQRSRFSKLLSYLRPHWKQVLIGVVALFVVNAVGVYIPLLIRDIIERLQ